MSATAKKWTSTSIFLVAMALLLFLDISGVVAERQDGQNSALLRMLYPPAVNASSVVGICNSMDPALGPALQSPVNSDVTYAQVDSITRLSVNRAGGLSDVIQTGDWVLIKPNLLVVPGVTSGTYSWNHNGTTTDLRVIKSIIQQLVEQGRASRITIAEGADWRRVGDPLAPGQTVDGWNYHWPWFGNLSIDDMVAEFAASYPGITFDYIDLNYPPYTLTPVPGGGLSMASYYVPDAILNCDKIIAVAVMKTHTLTRATLTSKLYVGTAPNSIYAQGAFDKQGIPHYTLNDVPNAIERTISDLMSFHPPDFGVVECFLGTEGAGPLGGSDIRRNIVIAGRDPVAVDAISAYSMGMNPWDIDHLHWAHARGFGANDLRYINTVGPDITSVRYNFARAKSQGRANRIWLLNGTHSGIDLDVDMLGGQETSINPIEGQITSSKAWTGFTDVDDYMNLMNRYGGPSSCISYAFTRIYADVPKTVRLRFSADDGIKIWLNGSVLYTSPGTETYSLYNHDLPISLLSGENRLLIKVRNTSGAYGFAARVSETSGDTPLGITYAIAPAGAPQITLNSPITGATTADSAMTLSASVSDPDGDSITVRFYGDTTTSASDLIHVEKVASGSTVNFTWKVPSLKPTIGTFGLWHFNEGTGTTLYDASGNGNNGFWHCDSTAKSMWTTNGPFGYALDFTGFRIPTLDNPCAADYVEVPDDPDLDVAPSGQLTMEFWVRPDSLPVDRYWGIVTKRIPCQAPQDTIVCSGNPANYCIFFDYPTQRLGFYGNTTLYVSTVPLTVREWQYIAVTIDGSTGDLRFYKNGILAQATTGQIGALVDGPLRIGASAYRKKGVDGQIDEVRLTRRVLSADEIANNYKLTNGTYYWRVTATDGTESSNSLTRNFVVESGASPNAPQITLNSPANGATTSNNYMHLNASISSDNSCKVMFYGGSTATPTDLLYVRENVTGTQAIDCNWNMQPFDPEPGQTMGLWHFDSGTGSSLTDGSGNGNNGALVNSPAWSTDGRFGYALSFNGTNDYVSIPDAPSLDLDSSTGAITMEAWIYPHTSGGGLWRSIISKKAISGGSAVNYQISLDQTTGNLLFYSGHWPQIWISSVSIPLNQWSYVAVTLQASEGRLRFYRNGVLLDSTVSYSGNGGCFGAANSTVLTIGTAGVTAECFDGLIDDARITRRTLSSAEIAANYGGLSNGTYYWQVAADDGTNPRSESDVRNFYVSSGADITPPVITLNSPADGAVTSEHHAMLDASVSDQSSVAVEFYGGRTSAADQLLRVWPSAAAGSFTYDWLCAPFTVDPSYTMGLWHFDENAGAVLLDATATTNDGTIAGNPLWTSDARFGYCLNFDASGDWVVIPDDPSLDIDSATGELTMEAWIYPDSVANGIWRTVISKKSGGAVNYQMTLDRVTGNLLFYSGKYPVIWISTVNVPAKQWSYVAITVKASTGEAVFYRNGVPGDTMTGVYFGAANTHSLYLGVSAELTTEIFDGRIDEVRLSRRVLTPSEIAANYLLDYGRYYWKVWASDGINAPTTSGVRYFDVQEQIAPAVPVLIYPSDLALITDNTPTFRWSSTAGSGGTYTLQYATDAAFTTNLTNQSGIADTFFTPSTVLVDGVWYWHVQAVNGGGSSGYQTTPFSFTLDAQAPPAPTGFAVVPGHQKCKLSWTNPSGGDFAGVMIRRHPWAVGAYPEYDDAYPSPLGYPAGPTDGELVYQGTAEAFIDSNSTVLMPRNVYYYSIFAYDAAGNYTVAGIEQQGRATNYWLGDVSGDGKVWYEDLMILSNTFRASQGDGNYVAGFDIGPTVTGSPRGIPTTDNVVNYEDLAIFAINFGVVNPNMKILPILGKGEVAGGLALGLRLPETDVAIGDEFDVGVQLQNNPGSVKAVHFMVRYDPSQLEFVSQDRSLALKEASDLLFYNGRQVGQTVDVCLALLGEGSTIGGSGDLATLRFRLLRPGSELRLEGVDLRDVENRRLVVENTTGAVAVVSDVPRSYGLSQNYPNPFNPETEIAYQLPEEGQVSVAIYNIHGQLVRTLVNSHQVAGTHRVRWDGRTGDGNEVSSGVYLYRMVSGDYRATRKMLMIK